MEKEQVVAIINGWISYAHKIKSDIVPGLYLLIDFTEGGFSDKYYRCYSDKVKETLAKIDKSKGNNKEVCEYIENIVNKYVGEYKEGDGQEELFKD